MRGRAYGFHKSPSLSASPLSCYPQDVFKSNSILPLRGHLDPCVCVCLCWGLRGRARRIPQVSLPILSASSFSFSLFLNGLLSTGCVRIKQHFASDGSLGSVCACGCGCVGVGCVFMFMCLCLCMLSVCLWFIKKVDLLPFRFQSFSWKLPIRAILIRAKRIPNFYQIFRAPNANWILRCENAWT